jgi:hypothetical protein
VETSFPDRYYVLKKIKLFRIFILLVPVLIGIGCDSKKDYYVDPVPVFGKIVNIDSSYTSVRAISTGNSSLLFCGKKDIFDSYSIIKFDSIPEDFDSLFLSLKSDSASVMLSLYKLKKEWSEDSTYLWGNIDSLIDTLNPFQFKAVNDSNPQMFIGSSSTLGEVLIKEINSYGLALHTDTFYSFKAEKSKLKVKSQDTLADSIFSCVEDAYIVKNPFQDTIFSDSLLVGRGLSIRAHIFIPRDSLPADLNSIAKAKLVLDVDSVFPFDLEAILGNALFYSIYTAEDDSVKFEVGAFFKQAAVDSNLHVRIKAINERQNIGFEKLGEGVIQFIWAELPR